MVEGPDSRCEAEPTGQDGAQEAPRRRVRPVARVAERGGRNSVAGDDHEPVESFYDLACSGLHESSARSAASARTGGDEAAEAAT